MGKALYRTYRSKKLSEIVGQEHITQALTNALKSGAISHAYLFTGPRGSGKTSIARILAHEINALPYTSDTNHLDIIEIDAASNRRIDEIRSLRDKVHIAPSSAKFKVYIIDEVHMLTREAFNALLKTLEEPPAHAVFILATTEVHKLPETIISRTQRFSFKPVELDKVAAHLRHIADKEKISIDDGALTLIAAHGEGAFRDSIGLLDQARSIGRAITKADVETILGIAPTALVTQLLQCVYAHQAAQTAQTLQKLFDQGSDAAQIAKQLSAALRADVLSGTPHLSHELLFTLLGKLIEVPASSDPKMYLEIILLDTALAGEPQAIQAMPPSPHSGVKATTKTKETITTAEVPKAAAEPAAQAPPIIQDASAEPVTAAVESKTIHIDTPEPVASDRTEAASTQPKGNATFDSTMWPEVLAVIKKNHNTLHSILKSAEPRFSESTITLAFNFAFHQKRMNESHNKQIIAETVRGICGEDIAIACVVDKSKPAPVLPVDGEISHTVKATGTSDAPENTADISDELSEDYYIRQAEEEAAKRPITAINNIFGGAELLES